MVLAILATALMMAIAPPASAIKITKFPTGLGGGHITAGPDGNLWFTAGSSAPEPKCSPIERYGSIARITPAGVVTVFSNGIVGHPG
jgi:glucose/arabinose dehydrogenase